MNQVRNEESPKYLAAQKADDAVIAQALRVLHERVARPGHWITCPDDGKNLVALELGTEKSEVFCVLWLNNKHGVLAFDRLFRGTIDGAAVPPREVVRRALERNAAAAILVHNHPSGDNRPSEADKRITQRLRDALALIDVRVLDHLVVGGEQVLSFAEAGLL